MDKEQIKGKRFKEKNTHGCLKLVLVLVLIIIISAGTLCVKFVRDKIGKINFESLNEAELCLNDDLYNEVTGLTQKEYDQVINIVLIGSDSKNMEDTYSGNSDALMIISINPKYKSIKLISIPRDTAVNIEGMDKRYKINYAFYMGKEQLSVKTVNQTFDLDLKEYITVNISAMYDIINYLGGIEVTITKEEMKYINEYVDMFYEFSGKPVEKVKEYGTVTLTGEQASAHVKERKAAYGKGNESGDYGRTRRQRDVLEALIKEIASRDTGEISKIIDMILSEVTTNIDIAKYTAMLPEFLANKDTYLNNVTSVMIPSLDYSKEIYENGAYLYVTDIEKAKKDFIKYMYEQ